MVPPVGAVHDREWFTADKYALSLRTAKTNDFNPALTRTRTPTARRGVLKRAIPIWGLVDVRLNSLVFAVFGDNARFPWDVHSRAWHAPTGGYHQGFTRGSGFPEHLRH